LKSDEYYRLGKTNEKFETMRQNIIHLHRNARAPGKLIAVLASQLNKYIGHQQMHRRHVLFINNRAVSMVHTSLQKVKIVFNQLINHKLIITIIDRHHQKHSATATHNSNPIKANIYYQNWILFF
jgi:hypothetical protein